MVTLHVKLKSELHLSEKIPAFKQEVLNQISMNTKTLFEKNTPRKSGRGANNYKIIKSEDKHEVKNDVFYLPFVNDGTGVYGPRHTVIKPKRAKVLHFTWRGREWFLKSVKGQKPQKFVERSMTEVIRSIDSAVVIAKNKTLE